MSTPNVLPNGEVVMNGLVNDSEPMPPPPPMEMDFPQPPAMQQQQQQQQFVGKQSARGVVQSQYEAKVFEAPHFTTQLEANIQVDEGEPIRLLTQVAPAADNTLTVDWIKDGKPLITGSRFSTLWDRGYVVLDILYSIEEDSGVYTCVASSHSGQMQSNPATVTVVPEAKVDNNTEFIESQQTMPDESEPAHDRHEALHPPQVVKNAEPSSINVNQGDPIHIELMVEPRNDVSLSIDWFKDGKSISLGSRTNAVYDRGYCALDIAYTYPEDNGAYVCHIRNNLGETESNAVQITCNPDEKIVTKSHLNEASISQLQKFDFLTQEPDNIDFKNLEDVEAEMAPTFDIGLQDMTIDEGLPAKFLIKVNSHPRARLVWSIDNEEVISDSVNKFYHDGSINYLELSRCNDVGAHAVRVVATNPLGQVSSDCTLTVNSVHNYAQNLKHIAPENPYKKMAMLKKVECTPELSNALKKPKPTTEKIVKIERTSEVKSKHYKTSDVVETEKLYDHVAANLKTRGSFSTGKKSLLTYKNEAPANNMVQMQPQQQPQQQPEEQNDPGNEVGADFSIELGE